MSSIDSAQSFPLRKKRLSISSDSGYSSCSSVTFPVTKGSISVDQVLSVENVEKHYDGVRISPENIASTRPALSINCSGGQKDFLRRPLPLLSSSSPRTPSSCRYPDRFVPNRVSELQSPTQNYRTNKDPLTLSPRERILRNQAASSDPFSPLLPNSPQSRPGHSEDLSSNVRSENLETIILSDYNDPFLQGGRRQVSIGDVWAVGGLAAASPGVAAGQAGNQTEAVLYRAPFCTVCLTPEEEKERHEDRLAAAIEIDRIKKVLEFHGSAILSTKSGGLAHKPHLGSWIKSVWTGTEWTRGILQPSRVLDAPGLRYDFYCTLLAYSLTCHAIAVGLGNALYIWSEMNGVTPLDDATPGGGWLTSLGFSSHQGRKCILAYGRSDGVVRLRSLCDLMYPRFTVRHPYPIACVAWKPMITMRRSRNPHRARVIVEHEDLLIGDDAGNLFIYTVEWPTSLEVLKYHWSGAMTLVASIKTHTEKICGLSWSLNGKMFATGGNDDICCLYDTAIIDQPYAADTADAVFIAGSLIENAPIYNLETRPGIRRIIHLSEKHCWKHTAAVKAIAFCPWQDSLVATGAGNRDQCIRFFRTTSGTCLAMINVSAQVTSLIWSTIRREIVATFGFAAQAHPFKIAVFSWPECKQVCGIPWNSEDRALCAIPYPSCSNKKSSQDRDHRTGSVDEGCIVVAASDETIRFHEVWIAGEKTTGGGLLDGNGILEEIGTEGEVIR
ncbi:hypothetical protein B7463_g8112, partial [Scytalidium lignicola]